MLPQSVTALGSMRSSEAFGQVTDKRRSAVVRPRETELSVLNDRFGR